MFVFALWAEGHLARHQENGSPDAEILLDTNCDFRPRGACESDGWLQVLQWIIKLQAKFEAEGKEVNKETITEFAW